MEPILLTKNFQPPEPLKKRLKSQLNELIQKLKPFLQKSKEPKFVTVFLLIGILIILLVAFTLIAKTKNPVEEKAPEIVYTPASPAPLPPTNGLSQRVTDFENKLETGDTFQKALTKPVIELDIGL